MLRNVDVSVSFMGAVREIPTILRRLKNVNVHVPVRIASCKNMCTYDVITSATGTSIVLYHKVREYFVYRDGHGLGSMAIHL